MSRLVVTTYILLFLIKLRFPKNTPFTTLITKRYNHSTLALYRKFENLDFKIRKIHLDIEFLQKCKLYSIIPKFLKFKLYNSKVTRTLTYKSFQFKLLNYELKEKNKLLKKHTDNYDTTKRELKNILSFLDFHCISNRMIKSNQSKIAKIKITHSKKLLDLGIPSKHSINKNKVVVNLSKHKITDTEKDVLSLGLPFALPKLKIDFVYHFF